MTPTTTTSFDASDGGDCAMIRGWVVSAAGPAMTSRHSERPYAPAIALSDVFGQIAEALGVDVSPRDWPKSLHPAGTA